MVRQLLGNSSKINSFEELQNIEFQLDKNNVTVQKGNTQDLIFSCAQIISYVSRYFTLKVGDLIYTGTPAGVGEVQIGDMLTGMIGKEKVFSIKMA